MPRTKTPFVGNILEMHYYANGTDGVSLQIRENADCLNENGEHILLCAADLPEANLRELDYHSPGATVLRNAICDPAIRADENELLAEIEKQAAIIEVKLLQLLQQYEITIAHIRNITSLPLLHLPASKAAYNIVRKNQNIGFVLHHHDFYWESPATTRLSTAYSSVSQLADAVMTPKFPNTAHVVINSLAAKELKKRRDIKATVIPDGFNFKKKLIPTDETAFFQDIGCNENDVLVGMMTRIMPRKGIQIALQFMQALEKRRKELERKPDGVGSKKKNFGPHNKIVLVLPQSKDLDEEYFKKIKDMATAMNVSVQYIGDIVVSDRQYSGQQGIYPFYSVYQHMDVIVYPSIHEGYGNQSVEAAWAKKLLVMHGYPVAQADIFPYVRGIIPMGNAQDVTLLSGADMPMLNDICIQTAVDMVIAALSDHNVEKEMTARAYEDFQKLCDIHMISGRYEEIYRQLAARNGKH